MNLRQSISAICLFAVLLATNVGIVWSATITPGRPTPLTELFPEVTVNDPTISYWYLAIAEPGAPITISGGTRNIGFYNGQPIQFNFFDQGIDVFYGGTRWASISGGSLLVAPNFTGSSITLPIVILQQQVLGPNEPFCGYAGTCFGRYNVINESVTFDVAQVCPVPGSSFAEIMAQITGPNVEIDARDFENYVIANGGKPPPESLAPGPGGIDQELYGNSISFINHVRDAHAINLRIGSGYRPEKYQNHFFTMKEIWFELIQELNRRIQAGTHWNSFDDWFLNAQILTVLSGDPIAADCFQRLTDLKDHSIGVHRIKQAENYPFYLQVNANSRHANKLGADAVDIEPTESFSKIRNSNGVVITDTLARGFGIRRTALPGDPPHFELMNSPCPSGCKIPDTMVAVAASPVTILVTDPLGRRIGLDPTTGTEINEIGLHAYYTGIGEPQAITIDELEPGAYRLTATPTGDGPYTLTFSLINEEGTEIFSDRVSGIAALGLVIPDLVKTVSISSNQPASANAGSNRVIRLGSSVTLNGTGSLDPDNGPSPLSFVWTQISGPLVSVSGFNTATPNFIPSVPGTYSFGLVVNDGQLDSAPSNVSMTVPVFGDIDLDGDVDSNDLSRITSALNTKASGPNDLRDVNGDGKIDALDSRILVTRCTRPRCATQ